MFRGKFTQKGIGQTLLNLVKDEEIWGYERSLALGNYAKAAMSGLLALGLLVLFASATATPAGPSTIQDISSSNLRSLEVDSEDEQFYNRATYISDNYHRCTNKLGKVLSNASSISLTDAGRNSDLIEYSSIGMTFVVGQFNYVNQAEKAADFVWAARRENLKPIIQIGTVGDTDFQDSDKIIEFYEDVVDLVDDSTFIATLAVSFETAQTFVSQNVGQFVGTQMAEVGNAIVKYDNIATSTPLLKESRACGGQDDESSCINVSDQLSLFAERLFTFGNTTSEFDVTPLLFDFYFISWNDYDVNFKFTEVAHEGETANVEQDGSNETLRPEYAYEKNFLNDLITNYENNGIVQRVIIGDFGPGSGGSYGDTLNKNGERIDNSILQERLAYSYGELSDDPRIAGVIASDRMDQVFTNRRQYQQLVLEGTNCNYDIVDYGIDYDERSYAEVVATTAVGKKASEAESLTRVVCSGQTAGGEGGFCEAVVRYTVKVGLPVRHCGSNSAIGTDSLPFTPPAVSAAITYNVPLDYLNQNAGRLSTSGLESTGVYAEDIDGNRYMLPWLHTCFNAHYPDYTNTSVPSDPVDVNSHFAEGDANIPFGGATIASTNAEQAAEDEKFQTFEAWVPGESAPTNILDEYALCIGRDVCLSKYYFEAISAVRSFNQIDYTADTRLTSNVPDPITHVSRNPQNMVYGTELIIEEKQVFAKGANQLAWEEYQHRVRNGGYLFSSKAIYQLTENAGNPTICPCYYDANQDGETDNQNYEGNPDRSSIGSSYAIANSCQTTQDVINGGECIRYNGGPDVDSLDSYEESDFFVEVDFEDIPEYNIEGAYDALYALYNKVQTRLSGLGLKLIANRNLGWEADVSVKAYSVPPFFKPRAIDGARENNFLETYDFGGISVPEPNVTAYSTPVSQSGAVAGAATTSDGGACRLGVNFGIYASGLSDEAINEAANLNGEGQGYGYGQVILDGPENGEDSNSVVAALQRMCSSENGSLIPVLRSCVRGSCGFSSGTQQGQYIASIINQLDCGDMPIYVACGHNEPKTDFEGTMAQEATWARSCATTLRSNLSGSNEVQITTPVFNGTYNDGTDTFVDNITEFVQAYGADSITSDFACVSANVYEDAGVPVQDRLNAIRGIAGLSDANFCIMETGIAVALEQGNADPTENSRVISELFADPAVVFALGFNWTQANAEWNEKGFGLPDKGALALELNCDAVRPVDGGSGVSGNNSIGIPGQYFESYNMYLTEGDNFIREYQYYEYLGWFDELQKINQLLVADSSVPTDVAIYNLGIPFCDSIDRKQVFEEGEEVCLDTYAAPGSSEYRDSNLGQFLCDQGYNVQGEQCVLQCTATGVTLSPNSNLATNPNITLRDDIDPYLYPMGSDRPAPNCDPDNLASYSTPSNLRAVDLMGLPYYAENNSSYIENYSEARQLLLVEPAATALENMLAAMPGDVRNTCAFNWGYRGTELQEAFGTCGSGTGTACACYSEHQLGTTLDFANPTTETVNGFSNTACYRWLSNNADEFGFVQSYKSGNPDGYGAEPWHWRWLPEDNATIFKENESDYVHLKNYLIDIGQDESAPQIGATNGVCPVPSGYCIQGPDYEAWSHEDDNAVDLVPANGEYVLRAPFAGRVVGIVGSYCRRSDLDGGDGIKFAGEVNGETYEVLLYHVKVVDDNGNAIVSVGDTFEQGEYIADMSKLGDLTKSGNRINTTTCIDVEDNITDPNHNRHIHMEFQPNTYPGRSVDMMAFTNSLGCGSNDGFQGCSGDVSVQPSEGGEEGSLVCEVPPTTPEGGSDAPILDVFNCAAGNGNQSPAVSYANLTEMIAAAADIVGVDPGLINSIIEVEYAGVSQPASYDIATVYGGNPNQYKELLNSLSCIGPGQFCPDQTLQAGTIFEYFSASGHAYSKVLSCAEQLGVSVNQSGQNMCPAHIGNAICGAMYLIKDRVPGMSVQSTADQRYEAGRRYYGSCETSAGNVYCSLLRGDYEGRGYNKYSPRY